MMRLKIGVMGGASGTFSPELTETAQALGRAVAAHDCVLVTGACAGLPLAAACGASSAGGLVVGISPGLSADEHTRKYRSPTEFHDVLIFTGSGLMGREVVNIRSSDIVIIIGGRSGTLGELAIAYDEGKLIGVVTGSGGISDIVEAILAACDKRTGARLVYERDPEALVAELLRVYRTAHYRHPSCFCAERAGDGVVPAESAAIDAVCGMMVSPGAVCGARCLHGRWYVFCSQACVEKFDAEPARYSETLAGRG